MISSSIMIYSFHFIESIYFQAYDKKETLIDRACFITEEFI